MCESYESKVEAGRENLESQRGQEHGHWHREAAEASRASLRWLPYGLQSAMPQRQDRRGPSGVCARLLDIPGGRQAARFRSCLGLILPPFPVPSYVMRMLTALPGKQAS